MKHKLPKIKKRATPRKNSQLKMQEIKKKALQKKRKIKK
jgi:hypothetical protein